MIMLSHLFLQPIRCLVCGSAEARFVLGNVPPELLQQESVKNEKTVRHKEQNCETIWEKICFAVPIVVVHRLSGNGIIMIGKDMHVESFSYFFYTTSPSNIFIGLLSARDLIPIKY